MPELLLIPQVAARLKFCDKTVERMLRSGELSGSKIRGRWLVRVSDVEDLVQRNLNSRSQPTRSRQRASRSRRAPSVGEYRW